MAAVAVGAMALLLCDRYLAGWMRLGFWFRAEGVIVIIFYAFWRVARGIWDDCWARFKRKGVVGDDVF